MCTYIAWHTTVTIEGSQRLPRRTGSFFLIGVIQDTALSTRLFLIGEAFVFRSDDFGSGFLTL